MIRKPCVSIRNAAWPYQVIRMSVASSMTLTANAIDGQNPPDVLHSIITWVADRCVTMIGRSARHLVVGRLADLLGMASLRVASRVATKETPMPSRRHFLAAAAGASAGAAIDIWSARDRARSPRPPSEPSRSATGPG